MTPSDRYAALRAALEHELRIEQVVQETDDGAAYLARELTLDRRVLVKALDPALAGQARTAEFARVVKALASLSDPLHPGGSLRGPDGAFRFVVLEHPEGETLDQRIRQRPLPSNEINRLGVQVLRTLEVAHAAGIAQTALIARPRGFLGRAIPAGRIRPGSGPGGRRPARDLDAVGRLLREAAGGALPRRRAARRCPDDQGARRPFVRHCETATLRAPRAARRRWSWVALAILLGAGALGFLLETRAPVPLGPAAA